MKFIILGEENIGKTSLLLSFETHHFPFNVEKTIAVDYFSFTMNVLDYKFKIQMWDTSGNPIYKNIIESYYPSAVGVILCFDLTNKNSFHKVLNWYNEFYSKKNNYFNVLLVGLKSDLTHLVYNYEIEDLRKKLKCSYIEVSSKNNINVDLVFETIIKNILFDYKTNISSFIGLNGFYKNIPISYNFCNCSIL